MSARPAASQESCVFCAGFLLGLHGQRHFLGADLLSGVNTDIFDKSDFILEAELCRFYIVEDQPGNPDLLEMLNS